jgi:hypothetical protein
MPFKFKLLSKKLCTILCCYLWCLVDAPLLGKCNSRIVSRGAFFANKILKICPAGGGGSPSCYSGKRMLLSVFYSRGVTVGDKGDQIFHVFMFICFHLRSYYCFLFFSPPNETSRCCPVNKKIQNFNDSKRKADTITQLYLARFG